MSHILDFWADQTIHTTSFETKTIHTTTYDLKLLLHVANCNFPAKQFDTSADTVLFANEKIFRLK